MTSVQLTDGTFAEKIVVVGLDGTVPASDAAADDSGKSASATFTPAATSHTANDCNGAAGTFALGAPSGCVFMITDANLLINGGTAEATAWR